jgi:hypothetical protein
MGKRWGPDGNIIVGPGAAHAPGLPFFELRLVQVCAHLLLVRPSVRAWRSPVRGDETGLLLGSFGGTSDGGGIHHEDSDIARLS